MTGQRPFRGQHLHQKLKRHILMIKRAQRRVPDPPQHLPQLRIPGQIRPHHQRVHEKPDQVIEGLIGAARHRRPHRNIRPRPQPRQQHRHRRMHRHEQRHPMRPHHPRQIPVHPARNRQRGRVPPVGGHRRAGPVHRQRQLLRRPGQRLPPVGDLPGQHTARIILRPEQLPLPQRIIGVLHRQRRPPRRPPRPPRRIRHRHIPRQRPHRPAITRDVMHHQHQHMHPRPGHQQPRPPRHLRRQIKRLPRHRRHAPAPPQPAATGVQHRQHRYPVRQDPLERLPARGREHRPQHLMPRRHIRQRRTQRGGIQITIQPPDHRDVIRRARILQLRQEPQPPLRKRQRHPIRPRPRAQPRPPRARLLQPPRQPRHRRRLKQHPDRHLRAQHHPHPRHHPRRQQRMPAEFKEAILRARPAPGPARPRTPGTRSPPAPRPGPGPSRPA